MSKASDDVHRRTIEKMAERLMKTGGLSTEDARVKAIELAKRDERSSREK